MSQYDITSPIHNIYRQAFRYGVYAVVQWSKMGFSPPAVKLLIGSKKLGGAKMARTSFITMPSMVGIVRAGCRRKSVMFLSVFFCLSRFGITKFVITETLRSSITFKTIMVPLHRGRFVVVHLCSCSYSWKSCSKDKIQQNS